MSKNKKINGFDVNKITNLILPERLQELQRIFSEDNIGDSMEDEYETWVDYFDEIKTPEELHEVISWVNWDWEDFVHDFMFTAINSPLCDKGTALRIYWLANPNYYLKFKDEEEARKHSQESFKVFQLLNQIEEKFKKNDFKFSRIAYDPAEDMGEDTKSSKKDKRKIPPLLKMKTEGSPFPDFYTDQDYVWGN